MMTIEVQFVPLDSATRDEHVTTLRTLLLRGAVRLSRTEAAGDMATVDRGSEVHAWPSLSGSEGTV